MTAYVVERFDRIDNRSLPAGMYVGAGPIGPDPWPFPVLSHYLFYPRHAYLLVVPHDGEEAREATASISRKFDKGRASGDLSARFYPYQKGSYDFARPEAPVHDLLRITDNRNETDAVLRRLDDAVERIRDAELPYLVLSKNSNTALGCLLLASGLPRPTFDRFRRPLLVQLRLPGIGGDLWSEDADEAISECTEGG